MSNYKEILNTHTINVTFPLEMLFVKLKIKYKNGTNMDLANLVDFNVS